MKVIDLLNKIANGEEDDLITEFEFDKRVWNFKGLNDSEFCLDGWLLNQNITITKHKEKEICHKCHKYPAEYNQTYCEFCLGISKLEEKKIPKKIKSNGKEFYCDNIDSWIDKEKTSAYCEYLMNKYNDLIDYLKSKGE